ncbi:MAG: thermopsin family protease [Desulfurococcus sp.]|nr:thermopsin family protease [Desulfurococcus sp.]
MILTVVFTTLVLLAPPAQSASTVSTCYGYAEVNVSSVPAYIVVYSWQDSSLTLYLEKEGGVVDEYIIPSSSVLAIPVGEAGVYYLRIPGVCGESLNISYTVKEKGLPMGVASYPASVIYTEMITGFFNITEIEVFNPNATRAEEMYGASLQLNAFIEVELEDGRIQYYWVQNVAVFVTSKRLTAFSVNIWNATSQPSRLDPTAINGRGRVQGSAWSYYAYITKPQVYSTPFAGNLTIRVYSNVSDVRVDFGYMLAQNGSLIQQPTAWFDSVAITPPLGVPVKRAGVVATMTYTSSAGYPLNVELVFGGYCCSLTASFTRLNAQLAIAYWDGVEYRVFPGKYNFGLNTAEACSNVQAVRGDGFVRVTTGVLNPEPIDAPPATLTRVVTATRTVTLRETATITVTLTQPVTTTVSATITETATRTVTETTTSTVTEVSFKTTTVGEVNYAFSAVVGVIAAVVLTIILYYTTRR